MLVYVHHFLVLQVLNKVVILWTNMLLGQIFNLLFRDHFGMGRVHYFIVVYEGYLVVL